MNNKGALGEGEVLSLCDPQYYDQLLGGWMKAAKGGKERTLKRRSPFSISAMRLLHPLLGGRFSENATFDRSDRPEIHKVVVRDASGKPMSEEAIEDYWQVQTGAYIVNGFLITQELPDCLFMM